MTKHHCPDLFQEISRGTWLFSFSRPTNLSLKLVSSRANVNGFVKKILPVSKRPPSLALQITTRSLSTCYKHTRASSTSIPIRAGGQFFPTGPANRRPRARSISNLCRILPRMQPLISQFFGPKSRAPHSASATAPRAPGRRSAPRSRASPAAPGSRYDAPRATRHASRGRAWAWPALP